MEKSRTNFFKKLSNKLSSPKSLIFSIIAMMLLGLSWILYPFFDGASEIFIPGWSESIGLGILVTITASIFVILYILFFTATIFRKRSIKYFIYMLLPIGFLISAHRFFYPPGMTRVDRRIQSFPLGAHISIFRAGGVYKVRQEALELIANTQEISPEYSQWPESIRILGAMSVRIDKSTQMLDAEIPKRRWFFWGDQFGYLITDKGAQEPEIVDKPPVVNGHKLWKIADGIYLYQKW